MHPTINVTFPRSGHHMTADILRLYFGDELHYCEWYDNPELRPEVCPDTNFTKTHDFHLTFPVDPKYHYLVLVRHPIYSLASWRIHKKMDSGNICEDQGVSMQKLEFWGKWVNKWILGPVPNRLIIQYESILNAPERVLSQVIRFLTDHEPDRDKLIEAICKINPAPIPNTTRDWIGWL